MTRKSTSSPDPTKPLVVVLLVVSTALLASGVGAWGAAWGILEDLAETAFEMARAAASPPRLLTARRLEAWTQTHLAYREDVVETWDSPEVALARGYGDCEEAALILADLMITRLAAHPRFLLVRYSASPPGLLHAEVEFEGEAFLGLHGAGSRQVLASLPAEVVLAATRASPGGFTPDTMRIIRENPPAAPRP